MIDLPTNVLYYGGDIATLRLHVPGASVDLTDPNPPFNSNRNCSLIFREESRNGSDAQLPALEGTRDYGPSADSPAGEDVSSRLGA